MLLGSPINRRKFLTLPALASVQVHAKESIGDSMQVASNQFNQRWSGQDRAVVNLYVSGIPAGQAFETSVKDFAGNVLPSVPWQSAGVSTGGAMTVGRWVTTGGPWVASVRSNGAEANSTAVYPQGLLVGDITLFGLSQSNQSNMCVVGSSVPAAAQTSMFTGSNWGEPTGDGARAYLNRLVTLSGIPQCVICSAVNSSAVTRLGFDAHSRLVGSQNGCWEDDTNGIYTTMKTAIDTNEGRIARVIQTAGESDALAVPGEVYLDALEGLQSATNKLINDRDPEWYLTTMRNDYGTYVPGADPTPIIGAQKDFASLGNAVLGPSLNAYPTDSTGVHLTADGYRQLGEALADLVHQTEYV